MSNSPTRMERHGSDAEVGEGSPLLARHDPGVHPLLEVVAEDATRDEIVDYLRDYAVRLDPTSATASASIASPSTALAWSRTARRDSRYGRRWSRPRPAGSAPLTGPPYPASSASPAA